jgi:hypothetical protein
MNNTLGGGRVVAIAFLPSLRTGWSSRAHRAAGDAYRAFMRLEAVATCATKGGQDSGKSSTTIRLLGGVSSEMAVEVDDSCVKDGSETSHAGSKM